MQSTPKKFSLLTVFTVVALDLMGFGLVLPLLPKYAETFGASPVFIGLLFGVYSFAQLIFAPIWGALSDRIGRRPIMLMSTLGSTLAYVLFAFSQSLTVLFLSRVMAGVMAGNISTAQSYVADVTDINGRARGMAMIGAAFGLGFMIGPAIAALTLLPSVQNAVPSLPGYALPGLVAAVLSSLSFLMVLLKVPETVRPATPDETRTVRVSIFSKQFWNFIFTGTQNGKGLPSLLFVVFLLSFAQSSIYGAFPLFCHDALNLTPHQVGMQYFYMGFVAVLVQGGLMRQLSKRFSDQKLFIAGTVLLALGLGFIPAASSLTMLTATLVVMSIGSSLSVPTIYSMTSKHSAVGAMGQTMGVSQSMASLGRIAGPVWGGALYGIARALPFTVTAALFAVLTAIFWVFLNRSEGKAA